MGKFFAGILATFVIIIAIAGIGFTIYINYVPAGIEWWTEYQATREKAGEDTYENKKKVEDAARALIVSYESNLQDYEDAVELCAANSESAYCSLKVTYKSRVNDAAIRFNEYMLENSFIWEDNIPEDIDRELPLID